MVVYKVNHVIILYLQESTDIILYNNMGNLDANLDVLTLMPAFNISEICAVSLREK